MTASPALIGRCHCLEKCDSDIKRICQKMRIDKNFEMRAHHDATCFSMLFLIEN